MPVALNRLNHAVLYVSDLERSVSFYKKAFKFEEIARNGGMMAFLRAEGSSNHHDLGLMNVGANPPRPQRGMTGLYHLAWEVPTIQDLADARVILAEMGALVGQSDHGATKSLYAKDPDGNEFEVMWMVPREEWGEHERGGMVAPLHLEAEIAKRTAAAIS